MDMQSFLASVLGVLLLCLCLSLFSKPFYLWAAFVFSFQTILGPKHAHSTSEHNIDVATVVLLFDARKNSNKAMILSLAHHFCIKMETDAQATVI